MKKYELIVNNLLNDFETEKIKIGTQIPTEGELMSSYNVSRITVRKALEKLEELDLIDRTPGRGTFYIGKNHISKDRKYNIALIFLHTISELIKIIEGINEVLSDDEININTYFSNESTEREKYLVNKALSDGADGIIIFPTDDNSNAEYYQSLLNKNVPIVFLDRSPISNCNIIQSNNETGMQKITEYLIEKGHKSFAYITGFGLEVLSDRYKGFLNALESNCITFDKSNLITLDKSPASISNDPSQIFSSVESLLNKGDVPSAFVCSNDIIALHVLNKLRKYGDLYKNIAVTGFDNANYSSRNAYSITTVEQDFKLIGKQAAKLLLNIINDPQETITSIKTSVKIIVRESA